MTYPTLLKRKDDYMKTEDVLMMTPEPCEHCKTLAEQLKAALAQIEALTIDNYFTSGKHHGKQ